MNEKYFVLLFVVTAVLPPVVVSLVALARVGGVGRPAQLVHTVRVTPAPPPAQGRRLTYRGPLPSTVVNWVLL